MAGVPPADDAIEVVTDDPADFFCPSCGYNLRGIPERRCPECDFRYDRAAIHDVTAGEALGRQVAYASAFVRGAYAAAAAWPAVALGMGAGSRFAFASTFCGLVVCAVLRRMCGPLADWMVIAHSATLTLEFVLLSVPILFLVLQPAIGGLAAVALAVDAIRLLSHRSACLPALEEALPPGDRRRIRLYQAGAGGIWVVALGLLAYVYL